MKNIIAATAIGLFAFAAQAQSNPPGAPVPPNTPGYATGKAEMAGEAKKDMRPKGMVGKRDGDMPKTAENGAIGMDKAAVNGEMRAETRDRRRPGKPKTMQGGTPK